MIKFFIYILLLCLVPVQIGCVNFPLESKATESKVTGSATPMVSDIEDDETVVFFHTAAWLDEAKHVWHVPIHGWIYEPQDSTFRLGLFEEVLEHTYGLKPTDDTRENFKRRTNLIIADNKGGKVIVIRIGDKAYKLPASAANGHFKAVLELADGELTSRLQGQPLSFVVVTNSAEKRQFTGQVNLIAPQGLSVISDIDDTIKHTQVTDHRQLFANTFFNDFKAVGGMPDLYREWSSKAVPVHFVSSSPWQLYSPLREFSEQVGFPWATFNLKMVRFKDETILNLFKKGTETKPAQIEPYLKYFPRRQFILIGDSGEQDPEVYAGLMKKYPQQIVRVYIRSVNGVEQDEARLQALFAEVDVSRWRLFTDPALLELPGR